MSDRTVCDRCLKVIPEGEVVNVDVELTDEKEQRWMHLDICAECHGAVSNIVNRLITASTPDDVHGVQLVSATSTRQERPSTEE